MKVTDSQLEKKLQAFADRLGLHWYHHSEDFSGEIDPRFISNDKLYEFRADFRMLLQHLGLEIEEGKRIVKVKKGKKS